MPSAKKGSPTSFTLLRAPGVAQIQKWVQELPVKTGVRWKSGFALRKKSGPQPRRTRECGEERNKFGTISATWIAGRLEGKEHRGRFAGGLPENRRRMVERSTRGAGKAASAV